MLILPEPSFMGFWQPASLSRITPLEDWATRSGERSWAVVTGASSGIGAAFAEALDQRGYSTVLIGRNFEALGQRAARLSNPSKVIAADLTDPDGLGEVDTFLSDILTNRDTDQ